MRALVAFLEREEPLRRPEPYASAGRHLPQMRGEGAGPDAPDEELDLVGRSRG